MSKLELILELKRNFRKGLMTDTEIIQIAQEAGLSQIMIDEIFFVEPNKQNE